MSGTDKDASARRAQAFKGLAELALLSALADGPRYGLEALDRVRADFGLDLAEGSIYPLLHRLEAAGVVASDWRADEPQARPRRYYRLTKAGSARLQALKADWTGVRASLDRIFGDDP